MSYRNNDGCGCMFIAAIFIVAAIVSGIRNCVNGDIKLPRFGSSHVSGGAGRYGTSNGYNVKYNLTTSPNNKSSLRDYTHTDNQPTEYREGRNTQSSSTNSVDDSSSRSYGVSNSSSLNTSSSSTIGNSVIITNTQKPKSYYKTCDWCKGTGKRNTFEWYFGVKMEVGQSCNKCGRSDLHRHEEIVECGVCSGKGKIKMEIVDGPLGETEMRVWDWE